MIGLNDTYKHFRSDVISHDNFSTLTFAQIIAKARDFGDGLKTETAISQHYLEESVNKISFVKPTNKHQPGNRADTSSTPCRWCGHSPHTSRNACPAKNDTCHGCGKRGHWQHVCKGTSVKNVSGMEPDADPYPQVAHILTHDVHQVQPAPKGNYVDLDVSPSNAPLSTHRVKFQVDSGCSCNTMHITDIKKMGNVQMNRSTVHLRHNSKTTIPKRGQATLRYTHRGTHYEVVVQVITSQRYYTPLLGQAENTRMGILNYDVNTVNQLDANPSLLGPPPPGELTLNYIKHAYPHLFGGLGDLGSPLSFTLNPEVRPIQAPPHHCSAPKIPIIKEALDKLIQSG